MKITRRIVLAFSALSALGALIMNPPQIRANEAAGPRIMIIQPWARATPGGVNIGVAYLEIHSHGPEGDHLIAVSSPRAARAEIHTHQMDGDVMKMRRVDSLEVTSGRARVLAPGGDHIMLFDLDGPLKAGERLPLTLTFKNAGDIVVDALVNPIGANSLRGSAADADSPRGSGAGMGDHKKAPHARHH